MLDQPCRLCGGFEERRTEDGPECADCGWPVGAVVDPDVPRPRIDVVYYLRLGERVKIGTTFAPRQRFAALPHDELLALERGGRELERVRHAEFAADRLGTSEWFALSRPIRAHVALLSDRGGPWLVYARWVSESIPRL